MGKISAAQGPQGVGGGLTAPAYSASSAICSRARATTRIIASIAINIIT
jgi:hypothetical protein